MAAAAPPRWIGIALAATVFVVAASRPAQANGAFPDSVGILLPVDRPKEIRLATNFGVISSEDAGKTWSWSCEQPLSSLANLYQVGAPPMDRIFTLSSNGLIFSDDGTCGWTQSKPTPDTALLTDFFPDPGDPNHVLAIILPNTADLEAEGIYGSTDGGANFGDALFKAPIDGGMTGIEISRSDPHIAYAAMYERPGVHPRIVKSTDGGATWGTPIDVEASLGQNSFRIIAIDPTNPQKLYLRVQEPLLESLAISDDGGMTFKKPVTFPIMMGAFARLASGTILSAGFKYDAQGLMTPIGYRSTDGGATFASWDNIPSFRALAERGGVLYGSADNFKDPFALGSSTDEGLTWTALMKFSQVSSINGCVQTTCAGSCASQVKQKLWSSATCSPSKGGCSVSRPWDKSRTGGVAFIAAAAYLLGVRTRRRRRRRGRAPLDSSPTAG
ncbi:MAG TPA: sialidase family protein [Polyangia bacterium]|jgi:hypothetical protein